MTEGKRSSRDNSIDAADLSPKDAEISPTQRKSEVSEATPFENQSRELDEAEDEAEEDDKTFSGQIIINCAHNFWSISDD